MNFAAELDQATYFTLVGEEVHRATAVIFSHCIVYGMHLVIASAAIFVLLSQGLKPLWSKVLLGTMGLTLAVLTSVSAVIFAQHFIFIQYSLVAALDDSMGLMQRYTLARTKELPFAYPNIWLGTGQPTLLYLIGDCVVLWRAWVIWRHGSKLWLAVPSVLLFTAFALYIASSTIVTLLHLGSASMTIYSHYLRLHTAAVACNIASNVTATALIGYQAYMFDCFFKTHEKRRSKAATVMLRITESGAILCVIQIVNLIINEQSTSSNSESLLYTSIAWGTLTLFVSTTYPALVVLIVAFNRTLQDDVVLSERSCTADGNRLPTDMDGNRVPNEPEKPRGAVGSHMSFAARPTVFSVSGVQTDMTTRSNSSSSGSD